MYLPFFRVISKVFVPVAGTLVATFNPGPRRRKLWIADRSSTTRVTFPRLVGFFAGEIGVAGSHRARQLRRLRQDRSRDDRGATTLVIFLVGVL